MDDADIGQPRCFWLGGGGIQISRMSGPYSWPRDEVVESPLARPNSQGFAELGFVVPFWKWLAAESMEEALGRFGRLCSCHIGSKTALQVLVYRSSALDQESIRCRWAK